MANILLIDDDEFFRRRMKAVLEQEGWQVTEARNGISGREVIKFSKPFDLVISANRMPRYTGMELMDWIKKNKPTPFVVIAGFEAEAGVIPHLFQSGADGVLIRPFNPDDLLSNVRRILKERLESSTCEEA